MDVTGGAVGAASLADLRTWFRTVELPVPAIPERFVPHLHPVREGLWSTIEDVVQPYDAADRLPALIEAGPGAGEYLLAGTGGYGAATRTMHYEVAADGLLALVQCLWGGNYAIEQRHERTARVLAQASTLVEAALDVLPAGERLVVFHTDTGISVWARVRAGEEPSTRSLWHRSDEPFAAAAEALGI